MYWQISAWQVNWQILQVHLKNHPDNLLPQVAQAGWMPRQHCQFGMPRGTDTQGNLVRITERTPLGAHPGAIFVFVFLPTPRVSTGSS